MNRRFVTSTLAGLALAGLTACGAQQVPTSAPAIQAPTSSSQLSLTSPTKFKTQWWYGGYGLYGLGYGLGYGYGLYGYPYYGYGLGYYGFGYPYYSYYWW